MRTVAAAVASIVALVGCNAAPQRDGAPSDSSSMSMPSAASVSILGKCCPDTDADIRALIARYEGTPEHQRPPEVALWAYRMTSGIAEQRRIVVRDSTSWATLWPTIVGSHSPRPPVPVVDFASEMLLVVTMGSRPSGGYIIAIDSISMAADTLRVLVREQSPGPRCGMPAIITAPVAVARMERTELPVLFRTREVVRDCE